jgi:phage-related protein
MKQERKILFYKDYFISFYRSLDSGAQKKLDYVLGKIQERISEKFVKFVRDGIYEIRASYDGNIYRAFFLFDEDNIVMLFNGFQKKTQKTPESEIKKALELKKEYYAGKK